MIAIDNMYFRHSRFQEPILSGVSFSAPEGGITSILGPNGSGKTTLLNCIAGLWKPFQGRVTCRGADLAELTVKQRAKMVSVVPQDHRPSFAYSVFDVVLMGRASHVSLLSLPSKRDSELTERTIQNAGISGLKERPYTKISGGERQLVLLARALVQEAPVLILDEPTSHLDYRNQLGILDTLRNIVREKKLTVLMTLHDPNLALMYSDYTVLVKCGRIIGAGRPNEVITEKSMRALYGISVSVYDIGGKKIIYPGGAG